MVIGKKTKLTATAHGRFMPVMLIMGRVMSVDKNKWTMAVTTEDGRVHSNVSAMPQFLNSDGGASVVQHETDSLVWLCYPSAGGSPFVLGGYTAPQQLTEDEDEPADDFRSGRPVLEEGDHLVAMQDGAHIIVRRGGVLEIGANEVTKRIYVPLQNLIREFSQNWIHDGSWGNLSARVRADDRTLAGKSPVEFALKIKEFAEDPPMIELGIGRIQEEDDQQVPNGVEGAIVVRLLINDRYKLWIDKYGNFAQYNHGARTESTEGPVVEFRGQSHTEVTLGLHHRSVDSSKQTIAGTDTQIVGKSRTVSVGGSFKEDIFGAVIRNMASLEEEVRGPVRRKISGDLEESCNNRYESIGRTRQIAVGGSSQEKIANTMSIAVDNAGLDATGFELKVANGKLTLFNQLGSIELGVLGTPSSMVASITVNSRGIKLSTNAGTTAMEVNSTGVGFSTPLGNLDMDNIGTVRVGNGPVRGKAVTTLTHPVCYISGAPILGTESCQVGGVPGPPTPTAILPSTFTPLV